MRHAQAVSARRWVAAVAALASVTGASPARAATPFAAGQAVEVREGDTWSAASIVRQAGRKYLVHYAGSDASTDEWVGPERIRASGTGGAPAAAATAPPATPASPGESPRATPRPRGEHEMFPEPPEVIPAIVADRSAVDAAQSSEAPPTWSVRPDPPLKSMAPTSYTLPGRTANDRVAPHVSVRQLLPCAGGGAIVGLADFGDKQHGVVRVGASASSAHATIPPQSLPMAASPSGGLLLCRGSAFGGGNNARIDAFTLGGTTATPLVSFKPYPGDDNEGKGSDVVFAAALSETTIVTADEAGQMVAWTIGPNRARGLWRADVGRLGSTVWGPSVVLSPGGKWLAAAGREGVAFVDPANGHVLGLIRSDGPPLTDLSCSPTGKTLVARSGQDALVSFDVAAGQQLRTVATSTPVMGSIVCPDDGFALVAGRTLIDVNTGAVVPHFQGPLTGAGQVAAGPGVTLVATSAKLVAVRLPDAATRKAAAAASEAALALKPGMEVAVDVQVEMSDADKAAVDAAIRKKLAADGFKVVPTADTVVLCRTEPGQQHEHHYGKTTAGMPMFLPPGSGESITLTDKVTRITIQQSGQTIWERKRTSGPAGSFPLKEGQSLQDGAAATIQYDPRFLINIEIPPYIAKPAVADPAQPTPPVGRGGRRGP
jgi:hypothetical protein